MRAAPILRAAGHRWPAVILAIGAVLPLAAAEPAVVAVRGAVTDEAGRPVVGHVVRLLKSRSLVEIRGLRSREQHVEELRVATDEHGFFEFDLEPDGAFPYYFLRFYDPKTFDAVKYVLPDDQEISRKVKKGRAVQATVVLKFHPDWSKVEALVSEYGPGSHAGQVLRTLGLPTRREPQGPGRELWSFEKAGVAYLVEGSKVLETHRLAAPAGARGESDAVTVVEEEAP